MFCFSVCNVGAWRQNDVCSLCEIGTYKNFTGDAECLMCPVNTTTMELGSTECGKHTGCISKNGQLMLTLESNGIFTYTETGSGSDTYPLTFPNGYNCIFKKY